jgi:hypothetical protein
MKTAMRLGALSLLLALTACGSTSAPTAPLPFRDPAIAPPAVPPPLPKRAVRVYAFEALLGRSTSSGPRNTQYVFYEDGSFGLQYPGQVEFPGMAIEAGDGILLVFAANGGRWQAVGTLEDGRLTVRYNLDMQMSDFEDAIYRLSE